MKLESIRIIIITGISLFLGGAEAQQKTDESSGGLVVSADPVINKAQIEKIDAGVGRALQSLREKLKDFVDPDNMPKDDSSKKPGIPKRENYWLNYKAPYQLAALNEKMDSTSDPAIKENLMLEKAKLFSQIAGIVEKNKAMAASKLIYTYLVSAKLADTLTLKIGKRPMTEKESEDLTKIQKHETAMAEVIASLGRMTKRDLLDLREFLVRYESNRTSTDKADYKNPISRLDKILKVIDHKANAPRAFFKSIGQSSISEYAMGSDSMHSVPKKIPSGHEDLANFFSGSLL